MPLKIHLFVLQSRYLQILILLHHLLVLLILPREPARVLMFGMNGEKILDVNVNNIADILDINFQAADMFNGVSQVELIDVILAGKGGEEVSVSTSTRW